MRSLGTLLFIFLAGVSSIAACSSSSSTADSGCASNPFSCAAGQVCAAKDTTGTFACLPSGPGKKGDPCQNIVATAPCGDGLVCFQQTAAGGTCVNYCEPTGTAHNCATGETCSPAALANTSTTFYICAGGTPTPPPDAGTGDDAAADAASE